jgi:hypothetical protein
MPPYLNSAESKRSAPPSNGGVESAVDHCTLSAIAHHLSRDPVLYQTVLISRSFSPYHLLTFFTRHLPVALKCQQTAKNRPQLQQPLFRELNIALLSLHVRPHHLVLSLKELGHLLRVPFTELGRVPDHGNGWGPTTFLISHQIFVWTRVYTV